MKKQTLPTLYIAHGGGPCFFMDWSSIGPKDTWDRMGEWLKNLASTLPRRPKAVIVVSAHWEESEFTVQSGKNPELLFDYYGFPKHTYELKYPAPGAPELARRVVESLREAGLPAREDEKRAYDHGVFVPFKLIFPEAEIPVIQLSLVKSLDPELHLRAGRALAKFRDEDVLIVGSGMSYHNLRELFAGRSALEISDEFDGWLTRAVTGVDGDARSEALRNWKHAPSAKLAHPREEHLIPLLVAVGAAEREKGTKVFTDRVMGATTSAFQIGTDASA